MDKVMFCEITCANCGNKFQMRTYVLRKKEKKGYKSFYCNRSCKSEHQKIDPLKRFWEKVNRETDSGCWLWTAGKDLDGYGLFTLFAGKMVRAHRYSYTISRGEIPAGLEICHSCDTPECVNPDHLWAGTPKQNQRDMANKNRYGNRPTKPGEKNCKAKLTQNQVLDIYRRRHLGESPGRLATEYGVNYVTIRDIAIKRTWKHLWGNLEGD